MKAFKCDVCGGYFQYEPSATFEKSEMPRDWRGSTLLKAELCENCAQKVAEFIHRLCDDEEVGDERHIQP